jgi:hypothetical protein
MPAFPSPLEGKDGKRRQGARVLESCQGCHARKGGNAGIHSVATLHIGDPQSSRGLVGVTDREQAEATMRWTRKTYTWGLLQGLWQPAKE